MRNARATLTSLATAGALVAAMIVGGVVTGPDAAAADPVQVDFSLEGCRRTPQTPLPNDLGEFVCPDNLYGPGNQGPYWAELDLVPLGLEARAKQTQTYTVAVAAIFDESGIPGFDFISEPVLNRRLSDPTCTDPEVSGLQVARPGLGGAEATGYRNVTISTRAGETCVYDWHQRLALGAGDFPGSSLGSQLTHEDLDGSPGQSTVSLPVQQLTGQSLSKGIEAARGDGYLWSVNKSVVPTTPDVSTCAADPTAAFTSTITWTRTPVTGAVTWASTVFVDNPSTRPVLVEVTDTVLGDGTQIDVVTGEQVLVPAGATSHPVLTHTGVAPASTSLVEDEAVARYIDPDTGAEVPGVTTATAAAEVTVNEPGNATAELTDVTTDADTPISIEEMTSGTADIEIGDPTTDPITWRSGTVNGSGSATLTFRSHLDSGVTETVTVSDQVELTHEQGTASFAAAAEVLAKAAAPTLVFEKVVDVPPTADATFRFDVWAAGDDPDTDLPISSIPVTVPAGQSQAESVAVHVPVVPGGYVYREISEPGYTAVDGTIDELAECAEHRERVVDERLTGTVTVTKQLTGGGAGGPATMVVDCEGDAYDQTVTVEPGQSIESAPIPSGLVCTISEPEPPPGYELVGIEPEQVEVPEGATAGIVVTNARQTGQLQVTKVIDGTPGTATTTFPITVTCGDEYAATLDITVPDGSTSASVTFPDVPAAVSCSVTEDVPAGWALTSIEPDGHIVVEPGDTAEVTVTDQRVTGALTVSKQVSGVVAGADTVFTVDIDCDVDGFDVQFAIDVGDVGAGSVTQDGIPAGTTCTVTEPDVPAGWELVGVEPSEVTIGDDPELPVTVVITNTRELAGFDVVKQVDGPIADPDGEVTFVVDVSCDDGVPREIALTVTADDGTAVGALDGIPTGIDCTITEDLVPAGWTLVSIDPSPVTVTADDSDTVTVVNARAVGEILLEKRLDGDVAGADTSFTIDLDCTVDDFDQEVTIDATEQSTVVTIPDIPVGVACVVTEAEHSDQWRLQSIEPGQVVVGDAPVEVVVTNERVTGGIAIRKALVGPVAGAPTRFSARLDCDGTAYDQDLVLDITDETGGQILVTGIPTGVTCTFTEISIPPQWQIGGYAAPPTITITDDAHDLAEVTAVNTRITGDVTVVKAIDGEPAEDDTVFELVLDCDGDLFDTAVPVTVAAGTTTVRERFSGIPTDIGCSVAEDTVPDGWELVSIEPERADVVADAVPEFIVTNRAAPEPGPEDPEPGDPSPPEGPPDEPPGDDLPDTGMSTLPLALLAGLAILAGAVAVARSRRLV